jgi:hypothetical protein
VGEAVRAQVAHFGTVQSKHRGIIEHRHEHGGTTSGLKEARVAVLVRPHKHKKEDFLATHISKRCRLQESPDEPAFGPGVDGPVRVAGTGRHGGG